MKIKKILIYIFFFLLSLMLLMIIIDVYIVHINNRPDYFCKYVKDEEDYQKKLILGENDSRILARLVMYNHICTKNEKEAQRLLNKIKTLGEEYNESN